MKNKIKIVFLLIFLVVVLNPPQPQPQLSAEEILQLVNRDRSAHGLGNLSLNPSLNFAAFAKAQDMLVRGYFAHVSPDGVLPWHWFKLTGYQYTFAGENLAVGFNDADDLEQSWMASTQHRANILSPYYSDLGLAVVQRNGVSLVVQFFGSQSEQVSLRR